MTAGGERLEMPAAARAFLKEPQALVIIKTNQQSRVHRRVTMDLVGVKRYDAAGRLVGIFRIVGLFTSTAYTRSTRGIPYLRRKTTSVWPAPGLDPDSHSGKALAVVLEQYPRDELFQIDEDTLLRFGLMILQLEERPRVRVLARRDRFDRFVSVLVYVPRDRFDSAIRQQIGELLTDAYGGAHRLVHLVLSGRPAGARAFHRRARRRRDGEPDARRARRRRRRHRAHLDRRARRRDRRGARAGAGTSAAGALSRRIFGRLPRGLFAARSPSTTSG